MVQAGRNSLVVIAMVVMAGVASHAADIKRRSPTRSRKAWSHHVRSGLPQAFSEGIATFGLLAVIWGCARRRSDAVPFAVGAYITGAYWFSASTSFANPAVTVARSLTDTFAGIRPADVPAFVIAQVIGGAAATALFRWLVPTLPATASDVVVPHRREGT